MGQLSSQPEVATAHQSLRNQEDHGSTYLSAVQESIEHKVSAPVDRASDAPIQQDQLTRSSYPDSLIWSSPTAIIRKNNVEEAGLMGTSDKLRKSLVMASPEGRVGVGNGRKQRRKKHREDKQRRDGNASVVHGRKVSEMTPLKVKNAPIISSNQNDHTTVINGQLQTPTHNRKRKRGRSNKKGTTKGRHSTAPSSYQPSLASGFNTKVNSVVQQLESLPFVDHYIKQESTVSPNNTPVKYIPPPTKDTPFGPGADGSMMSKKERKKHKKALRKQRASLVSQQSVQSDQPSMQSPHARLNDVQAEVFSSGSAACPTLNVSTGTNRALLYDHPQYSLAELNKRHTSNTPLVDRKRKRTQATVSELTHHNESSQRFKSAKIKHNQDIKDAAKQIANHVFDQGVEESVVPADSVTSGSPHAKQAATSPESVSSLRCSSNELPKRVLDLKRLQNPSEGARTIRPPAKTKSRAFKSAEFVIDSDSDGEQAGSVRGVDVTTSLLAKPDTSGSDGEETRKSKPKPVTIMKKAPRRLPVHQVKEHKSTSKAEPKSAGNTSGSPPTRLSERKTGPFDEDERITLTRFMQGYCDAHSLSDHKYVEKLHENAHNNPTLSLFWTEMQEAVENRDRKSLQRFCRRHWPKVETVNDPYTREDDQELIDLVARYGNHWVKISEHMGRSADAIRDRYRNVVKDQATRNMQRWSGEELKQLRHAMGEAGAAVLKELGPVEDLSEHIFWGSVSAKMNGRRNRTQCAYKWKYLKSKGAVSLGSEVDAANKRLGLNLDLSSLDLSNMSIAIDKDAVFEDDEDDHGRINDGSGDTGDASAELSAFEVEPGSVSELTDTFAAAHSTSTPVSKVKKRERMQDEIKHRPVETVKKDLNKAEMSGDGSESPTYHRASSLSSFNGSVKQENQFVDNEASETINDDSLKVEEEESNDDDEEDEDDDEDEDEEEGEGSGRYDSAEISEEYGDESDRDHSLGLSFNYWD